MTALTDAGPIPLTRLASRYEVLDVLGRGGMGVVYRGRDPVLNRDVAIKLVPSAAHDREVTDRFQREAQVVAQLDHPSIVPIYDFGTHEGSLFFVMPLVPGTHLRAFLKDGSLRLGDVVEIGMQVLDALDYSHARGVVHRDIKPENIMVARDAAGTLRTRVMDFGLARTATDDRLTKSGIVLGTVSYVSPEQASAEPVDGRSDVYSLASVLYECLLGDPPFVGTAQAVLYRIVHEPPQSLRALGVPVDEELDDLLLHALSKEPWKRPQRASEMAEALRAYRGKLRETDRIRPVDAFASRVRVVARAQPSPLIGRQKEVAELTRRVNAALTGECQMVLLSGEPGIGKTRLMAELEALARSRRFLVLHGRFVEKEGAFPFQGFCDLVREYYRSREGAGGSGGADLSDLAPELIALFPVLLEVETLRTTSPNVLAARARKADDKLYLFELLARTLSRLAAGKPALFLLENMQRAEVSIEALGYVLQRLGPTPTIVCASYRPGEVDRRHPLQRFVEERSDDSRFTHLRLEPLPALETRALVESLVPGGKAAIGLSDRIHSWTEGNPLFARELVRSLLASGGIKDDGSGTFVLAPDAELSPEAVPATIQQAVEKRVERLTDDLREVLSSASILGKSFSWEDLEAVTDARPDLEAALERLLAEGMLEEERASRGARLGFASGIVRDLVHAAVPRRRRRSLHRRFAESLERRHAGRLDRVLPQLFYHFSQGDVPEKAVDYGLKAATRWLTAFGPEDAVPALKTVLEFLADEGWEGPRAPEGEARRLLAEAYRMSGDVDGALREAEASVRVFEREARRADAAGALALLAETAWQVRRTDEATRYVRRGIPVAREARATEVLARLLSLGATLASLRGDGEEASQFLEEAEKLDPSSREESLPTGGTLVVALASRLREDDPARVDISEEHEVLANVFEPLLGTTAHGQVVPLLCERWQTLEGGKRLLLTLRADVTFSDGTPLTALVVKRSLERAARAARHDLPPALAALRGVAPYLEGEAPGVAGLFVKSERELLVELLEPLPIYPALLTDPRTGITRETAAGLAGTGPFVLARHGPEGARLERRDAYWRGAPPLLDAVEFRSVESGWEMLEGLREGRYDLVRDLPARDLEEALRDERRHLTLVETARPSTWFVLFACSSGLAKSLPLRQALAGILKPHELVWRSLGRFAQPATSFIPPGILGHDPGRRRGTLGKERAVNLLKRNGISLPMRLTAAVHPFFQDRYRPLLDAILAIWSDLGIEVTIETHSMEAFIQSWHSSRGLDLLIGRWEADYADPDDFCYSLFHSRIGLVRQWFSSPEADAIAEEARGDARWRSREVRYRRFESLLAEQAAVVPLFHEIDARVARAGIKGLRLEGSAPFVPYSRIAKPASEEVPVWQPGGGVLQVPLAADVHQLDPVAAWLREHSEVIPNVFETLTRVVKGARALPWLASEVRSEDGAQKFRFRLREGVRFHDGRPLTARDVRFSFERLLTRGDQSRRLLLPIKGARELSEGRAVDLEGVRILGSHELLVELERPLPFFPELLSDSPTAILPEGTEIVGTSWRDRCVGTGPFRVVRFAPSDQLELERNPHYWREGYPRAEGLVFVFRQPPAQILEDFRSGRFSVGADLPPAAVEALRQDPAFAAGYREVPRLSTMWLAFNVYRGPLADVTLRERIFRALDPAALVRKTVGRLGTPAQGLIPPGLLGHEKARASSTRSRRNGTPVPMDTPSTKSAEHVSPITGRLPENTELAVAVGSIFSPSGPYKSVADEVFALLGQTGFRVRVLNETSSDLFEILREGTADLVLGRWGADYPDADSFVNGMLHTQQGLVGRLCGSAELDRVVESGRTETDPAVRHAIYRHIEGLLRERSLLLPLFHEQAYRFVRPEVEGLGSINFLEPVIAYENLRVRR